MERTQRNRKGTRSSPIVRVTLFGQTDEQSGTAARDYRLWDQHLDSFPRGHDATVRKLSIRVGSRSPQRRVSGGGLQ